VQLDGLFGTLIGDSGNQSREPPVHAPGCGRASSRAGSIIFDHESAPCTDKYHRLRRRRAGSQIASTVPVTGDVNPYGVAVVPASAGRLTAGDVLVSNFNDKADVQGYRRGVDQECLAP
jgi:hypothetical protein